MPDSDKAASIASVVVITTTELLPVSVIGPVRRTKYTVSKLGAKILCILMLLRSGLGSEITMTLLTLTLDDWPPVQILTGILLCSISYRLHDKLLWIVTCEVHDFTEVQYHFTCS